MTVEGAPAWDLATLMPDGAVGASASGGRAVVLAQAFADEHRGRIAGYDAAALARLCVDLERVQEALTVSYAYSMLGFDADTLPPEHGAGLRCSRPDRRSEPAERIPAANTVTGAGSWRRLLDTPVAA
jgi:hypothetical protein